MKKTNILRLTLGACVFLATLSVNLGGSFGLNESYGTVPGDKDEKGGTASVTCPDGRVLSGTVCLVGTTDCTPTVDCDKKTLE